MKFVGKFSGKFLPRSAGDNWLAMGEVTELELTWPVCPYCEEKIAPLWPVRSLSTDGKPANYHEECFIRMLVGSAAHQLKECPCYRSDGARHDPPGWTKRQAAQLALETFQMEMRRKKEEAAIPPWRRLIT
jgi:hypothetical protein